ncbi:hypothetical protein [Actinomadura sp. WMMB 499]|uniref:hypothetical protein n=1 Tax=Actinomadura sp. WMMB 499 TaxID=1219491 RepID=UPI00124848B1|nr:hypothetical protein [Actinomadura sp. WMMB 499]QFG25594.1 hypothetical protein F7P10_35090 [Actinomadura sp. WMMB 499]
MGKGACIGAIVAGALLAAGCDTPVACPAIGSPSGVSVDVRPPEAARVASASLRVCWDGACRTPPITLRPSSTSVPMGCDGDGPDAACGASASPDGGRTGFAPVPDLPERPVDVEITLRDDGGGELLAETLRVTPKATYPGGPDCGKGGPQARMTVADGRVTAG